MGAGAVGRGGERQAASPRDRVRALDLMQLFSPQPAVDLLVQLSQDANADVRAKATYLLGIHANAAVEGSPDRAARRRRSGRSPAGLRGAGAIARSRRRSTSS